MSSTMHLQYINKGWVFGIGAKALRHRRSKKPNYKKNCSNSLQNSNVEILSDLSDKFPNLLLAKQSITANELSHCHGVIRHNLLMD